MALAKAGCIVDAFCPPRHPISKISVVRRIHTYRGMAPLRSLAKAIAAAKPDLIISGDDLSTRHLHHLHQRERRRGQEGAEICALIERSFGSPQSFPIVYARDAFMRVAEEQGVRVPKSGVINSVADLKHWIAQTGFPVVLKADGTSGGDGVRIARSLAEAESAFHSLQAPPLLARAVKRALVDRDNTLIWPSLLRRRPVVSAQTFVDGQEATSIVACWKGAVVAVLHFEVINKRYSAGPATVMRRVDNAQMSDAVEKVVRRLNLSGVHGFDFMLETTTENVYLIEVNPRATQVGHLTFGAGRDLPAAIFSSLTGTSLQPAPKVTDHDTIALFPQEWIRDPASTFLRSFYHDVPWEEPELLRACLRHARKQHDLDAHRDAVLSPVRVRSARLSRPPVASQASITESK